MPFKTEAVAERSMATSCGRHHDSKLDPASWPLPKGPKYL